MSKEWDASAYHRISDPQFNWGMRVLERAALAGNERVLDAGGGSGRLTLELARRVPRGLVVTADLSENMMQKAASVLGEALGQTSPRPWEVVCANLVALPFRSAFDIVFSTATFHWIRDHDALFASLYEALRPGGRVEAQCGGERNLEHVHEQATRIAQSEDFRSYFANWKAPWQFPGVSETEDRLRRAGFTAIHCWMEPTPTPFASSEAYREFIEKVVMRPFLERLPSAELRARFLDAVVAAATGDNPRWTLDYWRLNITASRS